MGKKCDYFLELNLFCISRAPVTGRVSRNIVPVALGLFSAGGYLAAFKQVWLHLSMHCQPGSSSCFSGWGLRWNAALPSARASILGKQHLDSGDSLSPLSKATSMTSNVPVSVPWLSSAAPCVSPLTQVMHLLWPFLYELNTGDHRSEFESWQRTQK